MSETITVGEALARTLEQYGVSTMYGIISIHNLPIADAVGRRGRLRFVTSRGEAGAVSMADAHGRFSGLGVALTSTGCGAGNAVGALLEAANAGTPLLHITGQVEKAYLDADCSFIHEARDQLGFLRASGKEALRVHSPQQAVAMLHRAIQLAQTPPCGPVSLEIPIDIQNSRVPLSLVTPAVRPLQPASPPADVVAALAQRLRAAQRPLLWVGGGALQAADAVRQLADAGVAVISSTHGRGILADSHPRSLRAFHNSPSVEALLRRCDLTLVAGSRLRSNETRSWTLPLPSPLLQIDLDPAAASRNYPADEVLSYDCAALLSALAAIYVPAERPDPAWDREIAQAVSAAETDLRDQCGVYAGLSDAVAAVLPPSGIFVRDITVSGSLWGSRLLPTGRPGARVHSLAGAIGMGLPMAIGTALANPVSRVVALVGDGGLALGLGELATLVQENASVTLLVMNDGGYGVMRGIQDKYFEGRQFYNRLHTPDFTLLARAMGLNARRVTAAAGFHAALSEAVAQPGPSLIEVAMQEIGPLHFAGPPQKTLY